MQSKHKVVGAGRGKTNAPPFAAGNETPRTSNAGTAARSRTRLHVISALAAVGVTAAAPAAHAELTISTAATKNVTCSNGVCTATTKTATLNASTLQTMLASGNVKVATGSTAKQIVVSADLGWATSSVLTLDANESVTVYYPISITGLGGLDIVTNDGGRGGTFSFVGAGGHVNFANLSSSLTINGAAYALAGNIATLASDIKTNPAGYYALANSYDASADGTYAGSPIATTISGAFEGLGNAISNLSISDAHASDGSVGFFATVGSSALVENVGLLEMNLKDQEPYSNVGALAGTNEGTIQGISLSGTVRGKLNSSIGGVVGLNDGNIFNAYATDGVYVQKNKTSVWAGALVGENGGSISNSFATGTVSVSGAQAIVGALVGFNGGTIITSLATGAVSGASQALVGGLVGANGGEIDNSYATGAAAGGASANVGGLVGFNAGMVLGAYSTGAPGGKTGSTIGGLIGNDQSVSGSLKDTYWDTTTSGISDTSKGAGNISNDPGVTGLSTAQLQSGLPTGFAKKVWGENSTLNGGLPYLLSNPPPS